MSKVSFISFMLLFLGIPSYLTAQVLYVDTHKGKADAKGTIADPLASLEKAVALASGFSGREPVVIKVYPGLYILNHELDIRTSKIADDTVSFSIEATIMPDDPTWQPSKMPIIQSVSPHNSNTQFPHTNGLLVSKNNVRIKGLKFVGNANPSVQYYYPITRENEALNGLEISQCYFIGEKNSAPIQGAIWAHGGGTKVDHSIFFNCKNALLLFKSIKDFSLTHSIIYGAYEAAVWFGPNEPNFTFRNNIVSNCNFFWLRPENTTPAYTFSHSLISDNKYYMGIYTAKGPVEAQKNNHKENEINKNGKIMLIEVGLSGLPKDYLNISPQSDGKNLGAGIFKKAHK